MGSLLLKAIRPVLESETLSYVLICSSASGMEWAKLSSVSKKVWEMESALFFSSSASEICEPESGLHRAREFF